MGEEVVGLWACPVGCRLTLPLWYPEGGLPSLSPVNPAFSLPSFPYPPAPLPRWGRGRFFCFLMQGASPLASPELSRKRHWDMGRTARPEGTCSGWSPADLAVPEAAGAACLLCRLSTLPLAYVLSPIPPAPFPTGRGRFFAFLCKGLRPLHPRGLGGTRHWLCLWKTGSFGFKWSVGTRRGGGNLG